MLMLFNYANNEFRTIIDHEGNVWFHVSDLCNILKISNPSRMVNTVIGKWCKEWTDGNDGRPAFYTLEPGFYKLVFRSKTVDAEEFQDKVFTEILPTIRKTGAYVDESRFNESEYNRMMSIIEERDNRLKLITRNTRELIVDIGNLCNERIKMLVYGTSKLGKRPVKKKVSAIYNDLYNLPLTYTKERFQLALDLFNKRYDAHPKVTLSSISCQVIREEKMYEFISCIYDSLRDGGNVNDTGTTENMYKFQKYFGVKFGIHKDLGLPREAQVIYTATRLEETKELLG